MQILGQLDDCRRGQTNGTLYAVYSSSKYTSTRWLRVDPTRKNHPINPALPLGNRISSPLSSELVFALCQSASSFSKSRQSYVSLVSDIGQSTRDQGHVDERQPGVAGSPFEVLPSVGVEFCGDYQYGYWQLVDWPSIMCVLCQFWRGELYRSISAGPGQGPKLGGLLDLVGVVELEYTHTCWDRPWLRFWRVWTVVCLRRML